MGYLKDTKSEKHILVFKPSNLKFMDFKTFFGRELLLQLKVVNPSWLMSKPKHEKKTWGAAKSSFKVDELGMSK